MKPEFLVNRDGQTVADAINAHLDFLLATQAHEPFELAISTAYFNPDGFGLLADALEKVGKVRLVLGAEPEGPERELRHLDPTSGPQELGSARLRQALDGLTSHPRGRPRPAGLLSRARTPLPSA